MERKGRLRHWSRRGLEIRHLTILNNGSCELFKAGVHAVTLGLAAVMATYNLAAWLRRREDHLAVNAVVYALAVAWERLHVLHHLRSLPVAAALDAAPAIAVALPVATVDEVQTPATEAA